MLSEFLCYTLIFRHTSVSSTYPCQSVRWSYFWISIAPEHVCAKVVIDDPPKVYFCVSSKLCEFIYKQSRRKRYWLLIIPRTDYLLYPEVQIGLKLKCQRCCFITLKVFIATVNLFQLLWQLWLFTGLLSLCGNQLSAQIARSWNNVGCLVAGECSW